MLDGYRSDPSSRFGLTVRISDPSAKAKRTDEKDSVLFVGGLGSKTTEQDVKDLFKEVSALWITADSAAQGINSKLEARMGFREGDLQRVCFRYDGIRGK